MDKPQQNDHLGINKIGMNIRMSPLHQPNFVVNANNIVVARPPTQPQVYNISKNDFKSIVQQLTGSPSRESLPRPSQNNSPKPQNTRLQRIRPAPLTEINRHMVPLPTMAPQQPYPHFVRPPPPQQPLQQGTQQPMMDHRNQFWSNTVESPISEYMRYLQSSLGDSIPNGNQMQHGHEHQPYMPGHEHQPYIPGHEHQPHMLPHEHQPHMVPPTNEYRPYMPAQPQPQPQHQQQPQPQQHPQPQPQHQHQQHLQPQHQPQPQHQQHPQLQHQPQPQHQQHPQPQPQFVRQSQPQPQLMFGSQPQSNMQGPLQPNEFQPPPGLVPSPLPQNLPSPRFHGLVPSTPTLPSPRFNQIYGGFPSPRYNSGFGPLYSPTSQFLLPSPRGYPNMFSPKSPYPLLSPGVQYPPPLTPNFSFSQISQQGSLGPGLGPSLVHPQPPPSPRLMFPLSPSGFFPIPSPR